LLDISTYSKLPSLLGDEEIGLKHFILVTLLGRKRKNCNVEASDAVDFLAADGSTWNVVLKRDVVEFLECVKKGAIIKLDRP
jgi:hypothetical protein